MAHRDDVLIFLRKMGDAYLAQVADSGVEPWELFNVLQNSLIHGAKQLDHTSLAIQTAMRARFGEGAAMEQALERLSNPGEQEEVLLLLSPFIDAAIQVAVASVLMLETLPLPDADDLAMNFLTFRQPKPN